MEPYRFRDVQNYWLPILEDIETLRRGQNETDTNCVGDATITAKGFIDAWKKAEQGEEMRAEHRLYFENLETLLKTLTQGRWVLLKTLRTKGPMSIRALAKELGRDYKNVYTGVRRLEQMDLVVRTRDENVGVPWDTVEARLRLAA
jgi:predicted transcriptional regulator